MPEISSSTKETKLTMPLVLKKKNIIHFDISQIPLPHEHIKIVNNENSNGKNSSENLSFKESLNSNVSNVKSNVGSTQNEHLDNQINSVASNCYVNVINYREQVHLLKSHLTNIKKNVVQKLKEHKSFFSIVHKKYGNDFCKIDNEHYVSIELRRRNQWKFKCIQIPLRVNEDYTNQSVSSTSLKYVWKIRSIDAPTVDITINSVSHPYYITNIVKIFEEFFNQNMDPSSKNYDAIEICMQSNSNNEVLVTVIVRDGTINMSYNLQDFVYESYKLMTELKSLYYVIDISGDVNIYRRLILFGQENLIETVDNLNVIVPNYPNLTINYNHLKILMQVVYSYLQPYKDTVLFELNSTNGLIALLLSSEFKEIIGFGDALKLQEIEKIKRQNAVKNAFFESNEVICAATLSSKIHDCVPISAIINSDHPCKNFDYMLDKLIKLPTLKRLVIVAECLERLPNILFRLMKLQNCSSFVPVSCQIVDKLLENNTCVYVFLMKRQMNKRKVCFLPTNEVWKNQLQMIDLDDQEMDSKITKKDSLQTNSDEEILNSSEENRKRSNNNQTDLIDLTLDTSLNVVDVECDSITEEPSDGLYDLVFDELTKSIPDFDEIEVVHCKTSSEEKQSHLDNTRNLNGRTFETLPDDKVKTAAGIGSVDMNRGKILNYTKRLQHKLSNVIKFMNEKSQDIDENTIQEVTLMSSYMLKTCLKIHKKLQIPCDRRKVSVPSRTPTPPQSSSLSSSPLKLLDKTQKCRRIIRTDYYSNTSPVRTRYCNSE